MHLREESFALHFFLCLPILAFGGPAKLSLQLLDA
jgi:hypothetical protein